LLAFRGYYQAKYFCKIKYQTF